MLQNMHKLIRYLLTPSVSERPDLFQVGGRYSSVRGAPSGNIGILNPPPPPTIPHRLCAFPPLKKILGAPRGSFPFVNMTLFTFKRSYAGCLTPRSVKCGLKYKEAPRCVYNRGAALSQCQAPYCKRRVENLVTRSL